MRNIILPLSMLVACLLGKICFQHFNWVTPASAPDLKPLLAAYQSSSVEKYALGFNNLIGASIWVQLLQNSDHRPVKDNRVSWEFAQIDTVTTLDPNNTRAYDFGAIFISTLRRDKIGGKLLLEKWTKKQPNLWRPWYLLGVHYLLEMKDYSSATPHVLKASKMAGAPDWLSSLGVRLMSESGQLYPALKTSIELLPQLRSEEAIIRLRQRARSLNYKIQKNQWQTALENYMSNHKNPPQTISELKPVVELKNRELSSLIESDKNSELGKTILSEKFTFSLDRSRRQIISTQPEKTDSLEKVGIFMENN